METGKKELIEYLRTFDIVLFAMFVVFGVIGLVTVIVVGLPGVMFTSRLVSLLLTGLESIMRQRDLSGSLRRTVL